MKMSLVKGAVFAAFCFQFAGVAKADTTCNTATPPNICYAFTNVGSDGGGVFDVMMEVTGNGVSASFTSFALTFAGATNVALESFPSGGGWALIGKHNNGGGTCNLNSNPNFTWCFEGSSPISGTPIDFVFDVNEGPGGAAPTTTHIQAFQGGPLSISNDVGVGTPSVPEPASLSLLGLGLLGLPFLRRRRS